eukprot:5551089-Prymnesium_polylepis.1
MHYSVYGEQTGEWTAVASDIMRHERTFMAKFQCSTRRARCLRPSWATPTTTHPNPCVLICPFA